MVKKIRKRDGRIVDFDKSKMHLAVWKAAQSVGGNDHGLAVQLGDKVASVVEEQFSEKKIPTVEDVQDIVERVLIENGHSQTAKAFILYRKKRQELREAKLALGVEDDMKLSFEALRVLVQYRLLRRTPTGTLETPLQMFQRVAHALSIADKKYGDDPSLIEKEFVDVFVHKDILPSPAILRFAGAPRQELSDGFVLPLEDDINALFTTLRDAALLHKGRPRGFGLGLSFSHIRQRGSKVAHGESASGPVSFLLLYDRALHQVNPYGVNMAFLDVHHPDIIDFLTSKESNRLANFGTSIILTKEFMRAVEDDEMYKLVDPHTHHVVSQLRAQSVFDMIATIAWQTGDPAVVFSDNLNVASANPFGKTKIEATVPTGEHPLLPYEGSFTASINLSHFLSTDDFDWEKLGKAVAIAVHLLDNAIDICDYPSEQAKEAMERTRRIGVGVMGWADALIWMQLPYNSDAALKLAEKLMKFIRACAKEESCRLAKQRGVFGDFKESGLRERTRHVARTTVSATGVASAIAGCSQGIEPYFAISYVKQTPMSELFEVIPIFEEVARKEGFYSTQLVKKIALAGSISTITDVPQKWRSIFVTSHDCSVEDHLHTLIAFQKHTDHGVSKTINMPSTATITEVELVFKKAYDAGCRSVHIYREGSSPVQLIHSNNKNVRRKKVEV